MMFMLLAAIYSKIQAVLEPLAAIYCKIQGSQITQHMQVMSVGGSVVNYSTKLMKGAGPNQRKKIEGEQ